MQQYLANFVERLRESGFIMTFRPSEKVKGGVAFQVHSTKAGGFVEHDIEPGAFSDQMLWDVIFQPAFDSVGRAERSAS